MLKRVRESKNILLIIVIVFASVLLFSTLTKKDEMLTRVAGFSIFTVKTGSMATVEPIGSAIIAHQLPTDSVKIGDDIVFYKNEKTFVTHRVVAIGKDSKGKKFFTTKGVNNQKVDSDRLYPEKMIGKVKLVIPNIAYLITMLQSHTLYLVLFIALCLGLHYLRNFVFETSKLSSKVD